ncbi:CDP-diacylglycerol--glycerol-3-phosphate 3-phosphatidyltransferase [Pimelobacter simplex]|uniref:CDP-diacylglycerol--glycerol-3-phosphate 3-phosphatidyltransferase n=1 Tax=Nocardioides simplex TaxID=2045 RepID=A0A0A1DR06_NOCSI|nr:CDP-diacylglycerol--glycerol-3-phosphate 3-phosphatidyltransferase [Pimelobacter simplex]AIY17835.1 CDP-diacylglycerol--glycerol-3-phosphate 3-phosphatidyltransferase [Pimelobacter simplex]MCG8152799.1 CDP-diacylglycerol--glycerol-3-phosphate 3-phosphatidyltransferase [Pimelobacter simplex]GEB13465.1 CDP-diacylglycerol--glycerol-3-phosphate 3-phosphatidyltransferase [Pimelobacter simplex]SFM73182.1 CDP-diacylglycerol--glycerol-3-phosphate 3-phosphatidyltransferase [Pimelobacter simplex]
MTGTSTGQTPAAAKPSNFNLPNALTTLRILLVPVYGWVLLHDGGDSVTWRTVAWGIFFVAMVTDKVDGDIARARNLVTDFGKIADPIADKAITGMAFIGLSIIMDTWWMWTITVVVLVREWAVTLLRLSVLKSVVIAAAQSGKWKTVAQALALGLLSLPLLEVDGWLDVPGEVTYGVAIALLLVAFVLTLWSGYEFFRDVWRQRDTLRGGSKSSAA